MKKSYLGILLLGIVIFVIMTFSEYAPAKTKATPTAFDAAKKVADDAMENIKTENFKGFFDVLIGNAVSNKERADAFRNLEKQLDSHKEEVSQRLGKPIGEIEFVKTEVIGRSHVRFTYLEKFPFTSIVWKVSFYKGNDKWEILDLFVDLKDSPEVRNDLYEVVRN